MTSSRIGTTIAGKYVISAKLGAGAMGEIYAATHKWTGREVAIKLLKPELMANAEIVHRFLREARAATKIDHPNALEVYDMGQDEDGSVYLVMERLEGEALGDRLRRGKLEVVEAVRLFSPVLSALHTAHAKGVIHRDLKPDNIFLHRHDGRIVPKLLDFGLARILDDDPTFKTVTGTVMGTPWYMSPEQMGAKKNLGSPTDVWGVAMVLYYALTEKRPYIAKTVPQIYKAVLMETPRPIEEADPGLPPVLAEWIGAALRKDASARPGAKELMVGLRGAVGLPTEEGREGAAMRVEELSTGRPTSAVRGSEQSPGEVTKSEVTAPLGADEHPGLEEAATVASRPGYVPPGRSQADADTEAAMPGYVPPGRVGGGSQADADTVAVAPGYTPQATVAAATESLDRPQVLRHHDETMLLPGREKKGSRTTLWLAAVGLFVLVLALMGGVFVTLR